MYMETFSLLGSEDVSIQHFVPKSAETYMYTFLLHSPALESCYSSPTL